MVSSGAGLSAVAIVGPTAVGKSDVADRLAARLSSEVLSCDAMQIYRGMDIGTAKMSPDECTAPLRLVDIVEPGVAYSAALYQADARAHVERLLGSGCLPVFCGGTGLYLKAALDEMDFPSGELEDDRRVGYQELAERIGEEALHALLAERDPESAAVIHPHNVRRVIRALEMHDDGVSYAQQKSQFSVPREHYHALWFGLTRNREVLYERINLRVDLMFEQGLVDEVRGLMGQGLGDALTSMQAIGYKEMRLANSSRCVRVVMPSVSFRGLSAMTVSCGLIWINLRSMRSLRISCIVLRLPNGPFFSCSHGTRARACHFGWC